jgi:hypothetical protein
LNPALRLIGRLNEREASAQAGRVHVICRALQLADRRRIEAGTAQPGKRGPSIVHGECQDMNAGIAREEAIQRSTVGIRIGHGEQFDIGPVQHRASVADTPVGRAGNRRQREAEALILACKSCKIAGDDTDMIERCGAHLAFS